MLEADALTARLEALGSWLAQHETLWRPRPFTQLRMPWEAAYPQLSAWLRQRSLADAESAPPLEPDAPAPLPVLAAEAALLGEPGPLPGHALSAPPPRLSRDVPGRKWAQVEAFAAHLAFAQPVRHWVDWCGGKGHLGRRLLGPGQSLTCLEYNPELVAVGQAMSDHHGLEAMHRQQDVLAEDTSLARGDTPVALHACGDLHVHLLQLAAARSCAQLAIAPCCYNRTNADHYRPLSLVAQRQPLALDRQDLGLPASEAVTAGARERRQRDLSMARRLGFDLLQRQLSGQDSYLPTPSLATGWLNEPFATYCAHLAKLKGIELSPRLDWARWEAKGWERLAVVRNLERVRNLFRRPLELWLVLDRARYLEERGYTVRVGTFCERQLTPRNLLIVAEQRFTTCG